MTTALCLFDLGGNIVSIESRKDFSRSEIAKYIRKYGYPVIIASDIYPTPRSIEKTAATFDARLVVPGACMSRKDKSGIVERYARKRGMKENPWSNSHEKDALFAALYAWNRFKKLLDRIEGRVSEGDYPEGLGEHVKRNVILEGVNIRKSIKRFISTGINNKDGG